MRKFCRKKMAKVCKTALMRAFPVSLWIVTLSWLCIGQVAMASSGESGTAQTSCAIGQGVCGLNSKFILSNSNCEAAVINDNYCDCGSDENLTSACSLFTGTDFTFQCAYDLPSPQKVYMSRVSDGICDCCDGSDEPEGSNCPNTCEEIRFRMLAEIEAANAIRNAGIERRKFLVEKGKEKLLELELTVAQYTSSVPETRSELNALKESLPPAVVADEVTTDSEEAVVSTEQNHQQAHNADAESVSPSSLEEKLSQYFNQKDPMRLQAVVAAIILHSGERGVEEFINDCKQIPFDVADGPVIEDTDALSLAMDMPAYYNSFPLSLDTSISGDGTITRTVPTPPLHQQ